MARNLLKNGIAGILTCCLLISGNAEITGSGLRDLDCSGQLDLSLWLDSNGNGVLDGNESGVPQAKLVISKVDAAELGVEIITADLTGVVQVGYLCEGQYRLEIDPNSIPESTTFANAYEAGAPIGQPASGSAVNVVLADGVDENSPGQRQIDMAFRVLECDIDAVASCGVTSVSVGETDDYVCEKPVSELSVVWNGSSAVRVVAHNGKLDKPIIADFDHIVPGQVVTVAGLEGSGSDVIWEIYEAGSDNKLGESNFHLSCSDVYMDGPEDCGVPAGDGKNDDKCSDDNCINDWLFAGLIDKHNAIQCLSTAAMTVDATCSVYRDSAYAVSYQVTNNTQESLALTDVVENASSQQGEDLPMASGQQVNFAYFAIASEDANRQFSALSAVPGTNCAIESTAFVSVMELPPACDAVAVELRDISHDKFKLRFTNIGDRELGLVQYQLTWPQEHETLVEVKWDGSAIYKQDLAWQALTVHGVEDFLLGTVDRMIPAEDHVEVEFKFDQHVHNSPQNYELEFDFDTDCSIVYSVAP